jgi:hypothetical protein
MKKYQHWKTLTANSSLRKIENLQQLVGKLKFRRKLEVILLKAMSKIVGKKFWMNLTMMLSWYYFRPESIGRFSWLQIQKVRVSNIIIAYHTDSYDNIFRLYCRNVMRTKGSFRQFKGQCYDHYLADFHHFCAKFFWRKYLQNHNIGPHLKWSVADFNYQFRPSLSGSSGFLPQSKNFVLYSRI